MSKPDLSVEMGALKTFSNAINELLIGLEARSKEQMTKTLAIKIANMPSDKEDAAIATINSYYQGHASELHGNVEAVKNTLKQMAAAAENIHTLYSKAGHAEEISVDDVRNAFNSAVSGQGQPPQSVVPAPGTYPAPGTTGPKTA